MAQAPGRRAAAVSAAGLLAISALAGCGGSGASSAPKPIAEIEEALLPPDVLGLTVGKENVEKALKGVRRPYIEAVSLYSFRKGDLLQATLQVSRFTADADWRTEGFRRTVAQQIVGATSELPAFRMGDDTVYLGGNAKQTIAVWFDGPVMMVLAERAEFEEPRALLRELVSRELGGNAP